VRWAFETPWALVLAHLRMIPVLRAEEALHASSTVALGSGTLKRADAKQLQRTWERQTGRSRRRRATVDPAAVQALGIGINDTKGGTGL
jgi:hypothetical protein